MRRFAPILALLALTPFALAACGGDDEGETTSGTTEDVNPSTDVAEISAAPDGSFAYEQETIEIKPGKLTVTFVNPAPIAHDFCVEDAGGEEIGCTDLIADGDTDIAQYELEAGEYTYYCSVAGHREGGMEGTLTVN